LHLTHLSRASSETTGYAIILFFKLPRASFPVDQLNVVLGPCGAKDKFTASTIRSEDDIN